MMTYSDGQSGHKYTSAGGNTHQQEIFIPAVKTKNDAWQVNVTTLHSNHHRFSKYKTHACPFAGQPKASPTGHIQLKIPSRGSYAVLFIRSGPDVAPCDAAS